MKGSLTEVLLESVLEVLPLDFTVIDAGDRIVAWNRHESRIFKRRESVLGKDVRACHRSESLPLIESILTALKSGASDREEFTIRRGGADGEADELLVVYWALRDREGNYLGCMETTQVVRSAGSRPG